eukprot:TRINITY_DN827_c1_g2_i2.p1 TRINITY_DN827_c1_g2~~TRINITY_DN827_c1_g2_i2.p1  ORF type:complete len:115 (-),score=27.67 TRINITY_DN827_c1_g2_i2:100-444(-)
MSEVGHNVGTKLLFENERVAVWEMVLEPGESCELHRHARDYVFRIDSGSTLQINGANGEDLGLKEVKAGSFHPFTLSPDGDSLVGDELWGTIPAVHSAKNVGPTTFKELLIESK